MAIIFNQLSELCFEHKDGYYLFILGKQYNVNNVYFCSCANNENYIGFFPIEKARLLAELKNCKENFTKESINQKALLEGLEFYYKTCIKNNNATSIYFTCPISDIFKILQQTKLQNTPCIVPSN